MYDKRTSVVVLHRDESSFGSDVRVLPDHNLEWIHVVPAEPGEVQVATVASGVWVVRCPHKQQEAAAAWWLGATFASGDWIVFSHEGQPRLAGVLAALLEQREAVAGVAVPAPPADMANLDVQQLNQLFKQQGGFSVLSDYPFAVERNLLHEVFSNHFKTHYLESVFLRLLREYGVRGGFTDLNRQRSLLRHVLPVTLVEKRPGGTRKQASRSLSVVIPVRDEASTLVILLAEVARLNPAEIIVVVNGSTDESAAIARDYGCRVVEFAEPLGHDVGRSIGAMYATGHTLLFLDGDMVVAAKELEPFVKAIEAGADLALNDIRPFTAPREHWDIVTNLKYWLNSRLGRTDLAIASLTAVPHAINRRLLGAAQIQNLAVPPKAYAEFVAGEADVRLAAAVDVLTKNRRRPAHQGKRQCGNPMEQLILGDHLEAFAWLLDPSAAQDSTPEEVERKFRAKSI